MRIPKLNLCPLEDRSGILFTPSGGPAFKITSAELDQLILGMIAIRAGLLPEHKGGAPDAGARMMSAPELQWAIGPGTESGTSQIALFHPGFGWWCVNLGDAETLHAAGILVDLTADADGKKSN